MTLTANQPRRQTVVGFLVAVCLVFSGLQIYCQFLHQFSSSPLPATHSSEHHHSGASKPASHSHSNALEHCSLCFLHILTPLVSFDLEVFRSLLHLFIVLWASAVLARAEFLKSIAPRGPPAIFS